MELDIRERHVNSVQKQRYTKQISVALMTAIKK